MTAHLQIASFNSTAVIALPSPRAGCDANGSWWVHTPRHLLWPHADRGSAVRHVRWLKSHFEVQSL